MNSLEDQKNIIDIATERVRELFESRPDEVHGYEHAERVAVHAVHIAQEEGVDTLMPALVAWIHDIGRAVEDHPDAFPQYDANKTHHELSYDMLRDWFREDERFSILTDAQKLELLYAVRNHWNDEACEYTSAYILRDADKIDGLGEIGLRRHKVHCSDSEEKYVMDIRLRYEWIYHFKTETGKKMVEEMNLMVPFEKERNRILKEAIKPVEL